MGQGSIQIIDIHTIWRSNRTGIFLSNLKLSQNISSKSLLSFHIGFRVMYDSAILECLYLFSSSLYCRLLFRDRASFLKSLLLSIAQSNGNISLQNRGKKKLDSTNHLIEPWKANYDVGWWTISMWCLPGQKESKIICWSWTCLRLLERRTEQPLQIILDQDWKTFILHIRTHDSKVLNHKISLQWSKSDFYILMQIQSW